MSDTPADIDVLICGAGPVGLALAIELARRGSSVRIIDRAPAPATESRALGTQARTIEHLRMMGIDERDLQPSLRLRGLAVHDGQREVAVIPTRVERPDIVYDGLLIMSQAATERVLLARLTELGVEVERPVALAALSQDEHAVHATLSGPDGNETVHARYLAGCDGARSSVRHHLRAEFEGVTYPQEFLLADCRIGWDRPRDLGNAWLHPDGLLFALPLPEGDLWRVIVNADRPAPEEKASPTLEEIAAIAAARTGGDLPLLDATWLSRFRINRRMVERYRHGRVFLAGDAAHIHSPVGGQGMNTGIQDAVNLGWKLALAARGRAADSLLDTYAEERMPVARAVLTGTDRGTRAIMARNPVLRWTRDRAIAAATSVPAARGLIAEHLSELGVNCRESSLTGPPARPGFDPRAPRPGDRAPQASFLALPGTEDMTLFDRYGEGGFMLLLFPDPGDPDRSLVDAATLGEWVREQTGGDVRPLLVLPGGLGEMAVSLPVALDRTGEIRRVFGAQAGAAVLVRPDGYIAMRTAPLAPAAVWRALGQVFAGDIVPDLGQGEGDPG
jgi:2-polyprenyl-6-methoxyphenol hydroxylase-like FAD-dependent oxidoreductase